MQRNSNNLDKFAKRNFHDIHSVFNSGVQNLFHDGQVRDLKSEIKASPMKNVQVHIDE